MRHMQLVIGTDPEAARRSYVDLLGRRGIVISASTDVYVEAVHRSKGRASAWLCYIGAAGQQAA